MRATITKEKAVERINYALQRLGQREVGNEFFNRFVLPYFKFGGLLFADEASVSFKRRAGGWSAEISWSSTHRSVDEALAAIDAYHEATVFAAKLQAVLNELPPIEEEAAKEA